MNRGEPYRGLDLTWLAPTTARAGAPPASGERGCCFLRLPAGLSQVPVASPADEGHPIQETLLTAFLCLLGRTIQQDEVGIDLPAQGPCRAAGMRAGGAIRFFRLQADLSGNPSFDEARARVRAALAAGGSKEQRTGGAAGAAPGGDAGCASVLLVHGCAEPESITHVQPRHDLALVLEESPEGPAAHLDFRADLFAAAAVERLAASLQVLLASAVRDPARRVGELPLLSDEERRRIVVEWNDTAAEFPSDTCIHRLFEAQVERAPDAVALAASGVELSYGELNRRANQLAHHLARTGVRTGDRVAIYLERSLEMVVAILGVLKAGGAYLCLDPGYPRDRLAFIWRDVQASALISRKALLDDPPFPAERALCLDAGWPAIARESGTNPASAVAPDDLSYVIYTSGSTGRPKGILLHHRGLCNLITASNALFEVGAHSRVLQFASPSFDVSVWEIFMALSAGARLHLPSLDPRLIAVELPGLLREQRITMALLAPSLLAVLPSRGLPHLRTVIAVGERVTIENVKRWAPGRRFFNCYGPAEATVTVSGHLTSEHASYPALGPPIGRPLANIRLYVLDRHMQPLPIGVPGELHVGGVGVARGYIARAELTAQKFVPDPFDSAPSARLYKTGDLARYLPDGDIEFLGRRDRQVKFRGQRIELEEIESVLREHPAVQDAVAVVQRKPGQPQRLAAFYLRCRERAADPEELRVHLQGALPAYMIPSALMPLDAFPRNPNGKVDRLALESL